MRARARRILAALLVATVLGCEVEPSASRGPRPADALLDSSREGAAPSRPDTADSDQVTRAIEDVLAENTEPWMKLQGVEGTGIGECDGVPCIKIYVSRPPEDFAGTLPDSLEGHAIRLEPTGEFEVR